MSNNRFKPNRRQFLTGAAMLTSGCASITRDPNPVTTTEEQSIMEMEVTAENTTTTKTETTTSTTTSTTTTIESVTDVGNFEDLDNWVADVGSVSKLYGDSRSNSPSIHLSCEPTDKRVMGTYDFPAPLDFSNHHLTFAYKYAPNTRGTRLSVFLKAPDSDNMLVYKVVARPGNGWMQGSLSTPHHIVGDPNLNRVQQITFTQWTGGGEKEAISLDDLTLVNRPKKPTIIFTFDDGHKSVYEKAAPILEEYGYNASIAVIPSHVPYDDYISMTGLDELHSRGWDMMSHPQESEPLPEYSANKQKQLIVESKQWLRDHGFENGSRFFVYPYSQWDRTTLEHVRKLHELAFADDGTTTWRPPMPAHVPRIKGDDPAKMKTYIERLRKFNGVIVIMYHAINSKWITKEGLREVVEYIDNRPDLDVLSVSDWYDSITAQK